MGLIENLSFLTLIFLISLFVLVWKKAKETEKIWNAIEYEMQREILCDWYNKGEL